MGILMPHCSKWSHSKDENLVKNGKLSKQRKTFFIQKSRFSYIGGGRTLLYQRSPWLTRRNEQNTLSPYITEAVRLRACNGSSGGGGEPGSESRPEPQRGCSECRLRSLDAKQSSVGDWYKIDGAFLIRQRKTTRGTACYRDKSIGWVFQSRA